jgi:hypothetical protein
MRGDGRREGDADNLAPAEVGIMIAPDFRFIGIVEQHIHDFAQGQFQGSAVTEMLRNYSKMLKRF